MSAEAVIVKRRRDEEEEIMTAYSPPDLAENWEFKILRYASGAFKDPAVLHRCLAEEEQAGWVLVEKFDSGRIRLKRPASARRNDAALPFDAYRTSVGMSENRIALLVSVAILGFLATAIGLIVLITR